MYGMLSAHISNISYPLKSVGPC